MDARSRKPKQNSLEKENCTPKREKSSSLPKREEPSSLFKNLFSVIFFLGVTGIAVFFVPCFKITSNKFFFDFKPLPTYGVDISEIIENIHVSHKERSARKPIIVRPFNIKRAFIQRTKEVETRLTV